MNHLGESSHPREKVALFYKKLIDPGGAERLLVSEFMAMNELGYEPYIICYEQSNDALFGATIPNGRLIQVKNIAGLVKTLIRLGRPGILCSSGHIDVALASVLSNCRFALHIHHPSFMTFNETDKYSVFQRRYFETYANSNHGAARFRAIAASHSILDKVRINIRAAVSIWAIRRSRCNFVLSNLARKEKQDLFGVDAIVLYGALDDVSATRCHREVEKRAQRKAGRAASLLTLARLDENKRIDELIRTIGSLIETGIDVDLRIAGRGPEYESLLALTEKLGLSERISFLGFVPDEDLPNLMREADLFVSIDWADYKLTMYEALSFGLPVLVSNETEVSDKLMDTGFVQVCTPEVKTVKRAILDFVSIPREFDAVLLEEALQTVTWRRYFSEIASELHRSCVLRTPPKVKAQ